jgi:hypothetical protein
MTMLYTIVPVEVIFDESDAEGAVNKPSEEVIEIDGAMLMIEPDGIGRGRIKRIISTAPEHFLDPRWQPGMTVHW